MSPTKKKATKASSSKGQKTRSQSGSKRGAKPATKETAATKETVNKETAGKSEPQRLIEPLSGTAAVYAPEPPQRLASSSYVPLSGRVPSPEEPPPSLPDAIPDPARNSSATDETLTTLLAHRPDLVARPDILSSISALNFNSLRAGCYLLRYTPLQISPLFNPLHYDGTMRIERNGSNTTASGDLYLHRISFPPPGSPFPFPRPVEPNPANGIPVFARARYSYYVRVTQILEGLTKAKSFTLGFELHRFTSATNSFALEGTYTALMSWTTAPSGYPSSGDYLTGDVKNASGAVMGSLTMGWVSKFLRRAVIEIDTVSGSERPLDNGAGINWQQVFEKVGWEVTVDKSDTNVVAPSGDSWSDAEMHAAMLSKRSTVSLDTEWRYHILCVRQIDSTPRGIMYDNGATDSNNVPREGVGISTHWTIPNTNDWGLVKGMRFGTAKFPFFRTALHEVGHAMGLYHNTADTGIMNTTDVIAASAVPPEQFPNNILWSHAPDDQKRLRHMPDMWVRPGGVPFGRPYSTSPISPDDMMEDAQGLVLEVEPVNNIIPLGAPVRINFALKNISDDPLPAPRSLSIKTGFVKGKVIDPSGTVRTFSPIVRCLEEHDLALLEPGQTIENSLTLLRGAQGALFPLPGTYRIMVEVDYDLGGVEMGLTGETNVMVRGAQNEAHAEAALKILSTPDAVLVLAIGGDHLTDGLEAIDVCLQNEVLRPHFTVIEARRIGTRFLNREADMDAAADLLDENVVASPAEIRKMAQLVSDSGDTKARARRDIGKVLTGKASDVGANDEIVKLVRSL
ncbi:MAG TPA: hypothetical protein VF666_04385 [Pyrinomonadaceae bacterium]|jgi:hypothetical protein